MQALAERLPATVPELRGAVSQLKLSAEVDGYPIDLAKVEAHLIDRARSKAPTLDEIGRMTARHFSLKVSSLRSASRSRAVVSARGVAIYLARKLSSLTLEEIGRYFGGRDHTTVSHGYRKTEALLQTDSELLQAVTRLEEQLQSR